MNHNTLEIRLKAALVALEEGKQEVRRNKLTRNSASTVVQVPTRDMQQELSYFARLWGMSPAQTIESLVDLRVWLHNLGLDLNKGAQGRAKVKSPRVIRHYSEWLDGIPEVRLRLPDEVKKGLPVRICNYRAEPEARSQTVINYRVENGVPTAVTTDKSGWLPEKDKGSFFVKSPCSYTESKSPQGFLQLIGAQVFRQR